MDQHKALISKAIVDGAMAWNDANIAAGKLVAPYSDFVADHVIKAIADAGLTIEPPGTAIPMGELKPFLPASIFEQES